MTILEIVFLSVAILVSIGSGLAIKVTRGSSDRKNRDAQQKLDEATRKDNDAEEKYRQEREARKSAEDALRRAEGEQLESKRKLEQAHEELRTAEVIRLQAQDDTHAMAQALKQSENERDAARAERESAIEERDAVLEQVRLANERSLRAKELRAQAELDRDAAIKERDIAFEQTHLASERAQSADESRKHAEDARDVAIKERDDAIQARKTAEENSRRAIQAKLDAEEQARLATEQIRIALQAQSMIESERDEAIKRLGIADGQSQQSTDAKEIAERERDEAISQKQIAIEQARQANEQTQRFENEARLASERAKEIEKERDDVIIARDLAIQERDAARERAEKANQAQKQAIKATKRAIKRKKRCIPPEERRGARGRYKQPSTQFAPRPPKPEIICQDKNLEWVLAVELPDDFLTDTVEPQVHQGNAPLEQDHNLWQMKDLRGRITVRSGEKSWEIRLDEREDDYLLFKLSGYDLRHGTRVRSINKGAYLVVVPEEWDRADSNFGSEPEAISVEGYLAYYYVLDHPGKIAFRTPEGNSVDVMPSSTQFDLIGNRLPDADEESSLLFGDLLPRIRVANLNAWEKVKSIVLGEEGRGRKNWNSIPITPVANQTEQDLPPKILDWQASWFFVRFYDENDQLIESTDFRLARGLSDVQINQASPFPGETGHSAASVEFHHTTECVIEPPLGVEVVTSERETLTEIPASTELDKTRWRIIAEGHDPIDVTVLIERAWWALGTKGDAPKWIDKPIALTREDFAAISEQALWIRLPKPRWTDAVSVGFSREPARPFPIPVTEQKISIPLCDFCDGASLRQIGLSHFVVRAGDSVATLAQMRVQAKCMDCGLLADSEKDILSHVGEQHLNTAFRKLEYDELRKQMPSLLLPAVIFECFYCHQYVTDEPENSTTLYYHIIRRKCPEISPGLERPPARQRRVTDIDEIRENVYKHLPDIRKCKFCEEQIEWHTSQQALGHLVEKHRNALYELR